MDLRGTSLLQHYDSIEEALRWALLKDVESSGLTKYSIAAAVDLSPSHFSKAINPNKSEDDQERRHHYPADRTVKLILATAGGSYLFTLLDALGYDPDRLDEIRRPTKTTLQLEEERLAVLKSCERTLQELKLTMQEPGKMRKR